MLDFLNITDIIEKEKANILLKYPSIQTYHEINGQHILDEKLTFPLPDDDEFFVTEKIDGENFRLVFLNGDYVIGSRTQWVYANRDRIVPSDKIKFIKEIADKLRNDLLWDGKIRIIYGELYGVGIQKSSRTYTTTGKFGFRVFDAMEFEQNELSNLINNNSNEQCSAIRESGTLKFYNYNELRLFCEKFNLEMTPLYYASMDDILTSRNEIGNTLEEAYSFLSRYKTTQAELDITKKKNLRPEGIVIRNMDRSYIRKLRYEDYEKTFRKLGIKPNVQ